MTVSKRVPADPAYPRFFCCGDEPVFLHSAWPIRFSCFRVREYPVFALRQRSHPCLMLTKSLRKRTVKRHPSVRGLCFYVPLLPVDVSLSYRQAQSFPSVESATKAESATCPDITDWITSSAPLDRVDLAKVIRPRLGGKEPSDAYYRL